MLKIFLGTKAEMENIEDKFVAGEWLPPVGAIPKTAAPTKTPKKRKRKQKNKETPQTDTLQNEAKKKKKSSGKLQ